MQTTLYPCARFVAFVLPVRALALALPFLPPLATLIGSFVASRSSSCSPGPIIHALTPASQTRADLPPLLNSLVRRAARHTRSQALVSWYKAEAAAAVA